MLKRSFASKDRVGKAPKPPSKRSFAGSQLKQKLHDSLDSPPVLSSAAAHNSAVVTISVGRDQRVFAAHEEVLRRSPLFEQQSRELFFSASKRIDLVDEDPETFSLVLEYLYRGDYSPRLLQSKNGAFIEGDTGEIASPRSTKSAFFKRDEAGHSSQHATIYHSIAGEVILRDTAAYCAGLRYGLTGLQRLALRKQGLQTGIDVGTILRSMRYAYTHTPDSDCRLRAHFLALIVRARRTFKRSGTMQMEMNKGGAMFFDLFVALCNHLDDLSGATTTPKTI